MGDFELQEIADGAWGDGPFVRGLARDRIEKMNDQSSKSTWAVASDFSEVIETTDGFGAFSTKLDALNYQIGLLEGERDLAVGRLHKAKRLRRRELKKP